jgi:hypothetical protein
LLGRNPKRVRDKTHLSRVDIELMFKQIKLFYSAQDEWLITRWRGQLTIIEYIPGLNDKTSFYPLEQQTIHCENGYYKIETKCFFSQLNTTKNAVHIYNLIFASFNN